MMTPAQTYQSVSSLLILQFQLGLSQTNSFGTPTLDLYNTI